MPGSPGQPLPLTLSSCAETLVTCQEGLGPSTVTSESPRLPPESTRPSSLCTHTPGSAVGGAVPPLTLNSRWEKPLIGNIFKERRIRNLFKEPQSNDSFGSFYISKLIIVFKYVSLILLQRKSVQPRSGWRGATPTKHLQLPSLRRSA